MKKFTCLYLIFILLVCCVKAQNVNYAVSFISTALLKNANAVTRFEETILTIKDLGRATLYHKYAITILNDRGDKYAEFIESYDEFNTITYIEGKLFDSNGKKIKSVKKGSIADVSASGSSLMDDNRVKLHNFNHKIYPYTIEYECNVELNGIFYFPTWMPISGFGLAVEKSILTVECPYDYKLRYKEFNCEQKHMGTNDNEQKKYQHYIWLVENRSAIINEDYIPQLYEITPSVLLAPTDFKFAGYTGKMDSWENFGKFIYGLNKGRDVLSEVTKKTIHELVDQQKDTIDKIKILYKYLQQNTRYVSIQLGIGGLQPFYADYVSNKGYGDCKALSNYMVSILKEVGIPAYYTLVKAGDFKTHFVGDFPSTQFNHVIVCVPLAKDSVWLECTSQTSEAGYLGSFTAGRSVLLISNNGGKLVTTPQLGMKENLQNRNINAVVDVTGNLLFTTNTQYRAVKQEQLHFLINGLSKEKVMEYLKNQINLPSYDVVKFDYVEDKRMLPSIYEELDIKANNYAQVTGKRLFVKPNIFTVSNVRLKTLEERKADIDLKYAFIEIDTVSIKIPDGYIAESVPIDMNLDTKFGQYKSSVRIVDSVILYYRKLEFKASRFSSKDYNELINYFELIYKSDRASVVLVKKDVE